MHPTSTQYINSLLHHLEEIGNSTDSNSISEKISESPILFTKALLSVKLDYTPISISRLNKLLLQLSKKYSIEQLLSVKSGERFFLLVAGYIGNYVAKQVGLPIVWHDYHEMQHWQNLNHQALATSSNGQSSKGQPTDESADTTVNESLPKTFVFSLSATIGTDFFCMPLLGVQKAMLGQATISDFVTELQNAVYEETSISPKQDANDLCQELLLMVQTGRLMNHRLKFYDFLKEITFDYSLNSLHQLDDALLAIKAHIDNQNQGYQQLVVQPAFHRLVFFLGFYIGISSAKLANTSTSWMNHQQAQAMIDYEFPFCLEHASVQVFGNNFRIPILTINNRLFELTTDYSDSVVTYAKDVMQENEGHLHSYPFDEKSVLHSNQQEHPLPESRLPEAWQMAMEKAGFLLSSNLVNLLKGGYADDYILPSVYEYDELNDVYYICCYDSEDSIELVYQHLMDNPKNSPFIIVIYESYADLPTGRMDGLVIEIRGFEDPDRVFFDDDSDDADRHNNNNTNNLIAQFVLPYRKVSHEFGFAIYPLVTNQTLAEPQRQALANALYKGAIDYKSLFIDEHLWADYYLSDFDLWQWTPIYRQNSHLDKITIIDEQIEVFSVADEIQHKRQKGLQDKVQNQLESQSNKQSETLAQKQNPKQSLMQSPIKNHADRKTLAEFQTSFQTALETEVHTAPYITTQPLHQKIAQKIHTVIRTQILW